jgi:hypothetical protein
MRDASEYENYKAETYRVHFFNWYSGGVDSNWVHSALRPTIGLLYQPWVSTMMEKLVEWWLARETEVLGENLPHAALSTTNPTCCPDAEPGLRGGKPATNRLSYGTALGYTSFQLFEISRNSLYLQFYYTYLNR